MGDKSTPAGETVSLSVSPAVVKYLSAQNAVFELSNLNIRLPCFSGFSFLAFFLIIYLF